MRRLLMLSVVAALFLSSLTGCVAYAPAPVVYEYPYGYYYGGPCVVYYHSYYGGCYYHRGWR